jgi:DNA-binding XRE family transcriptional regulator
MPARSGIFYYGRSSDSERKLMGLHQYDGRADGLGSYLDAVAAIREKHINTVKTALPVLRRRRVYELHISCEVLAARIGVAESTLNAWEEERHVPNPMLLAKWWACLNP